MYVEIIYEVQNIVFNIETKFTDWEKVFANHTADKYQYPEEKTNDQFEKWTKHLNRGFPKNIYIW